MPRKRKPRKAKAKVKAKTEPAAVDIFQILTETSEREKKRRRIELLAPLDVKEFFVEGRISIDKRTCRGVECKLCIKACPTSALFWRAGEVGVTEELCIYCGACVLSCIVDDCIRVERKRENGVVECFGKPRDFAVLQHDISVKKRSERVKDVFPKVEDYLKRYDKKKM
jgi:Fe-S-cluster-containing hydrogenase component 2